MKKNAGRPFALALTVGFGFTVFSTNSFSQECELAGHIESVTGSVQIKEDTDSPWQNAKNKHSLCESHLVRTGSNSKATVKLINATLVSLGSNTTLNLTEVDKEENSFLDLIQGIIHTLSRVPRSLEIRTPYVNAGIEGTEFVVNLQEKGTEVYVLEGLVRTYNKHGEVLLSNNEASFTAPGQAPEKRLNINPYNAVSWLLSYPPLLEFGENTLTAKEELAYQKILSAKPDSAIDILVPLERSENRQLLNALALLTIGKTTEAKESLQAITDSSARKQALESIIALVNNDQRTALEKADQALASDNKIPEPWLAKSYIQQAGFNIKGALVSAQNAENLASENALVKARIAELLLMQGEKRAALRKAQKSVALSDSLDLTHSSLGFALLQNQKPKRAIQSFETALQLNSSNAQTRLGLGLAHIKLGDVETGRQWLESAVLMSPTNSLLRSYLGKTYFEENRNDVSRDQLELAKQFDSKDPTPWFYESVLLHNENRPVEALRSMEASIGLNDQRAVYRSRLLLDDDRAARNASLGSLYQQLSFEQLGVSLASQSLDEDPSNAAAHRLLANSYLGNHHDNVARVIELRQAQLFDDIGHQIIQPQLLRSHTTLLDDGGPGSLGFNEFNVLLRSNGPYANLSGTIAGNHTRAGDLTTGYIGNDYAVHVGKYRYKTDGFGTSTDYFEDNTTFQLQWQATSKTRLVFDAGKDDSERGSAGLRFSDDFINESRETDKDLTRLSLGLIHEFSPQNRLTLLSSRVTGDENTTFIEAPFFYEIPLDIKHHSEHLQYLHKGANQVWMLGAERKSKNNTNTHKFRELNMPCVIFGPSCEFEFSRESEAAETKYYGYWISDQPEIGLTVTTGLSVARQLRKEGAERERNFLPKFGLSLQTSPQTKLNLAIFQSISSTIDPDLYETLAPTQIAGFNQIFTGQHQAKSDNYGVSLEHKFSDNVRTGLRYTYHKITAELSDLFLLPPLITDSSTRLHQSSLWVYWTPTNQIGLTVEIQDERFEDEQEQIFKATSDNVENLDTTKLPITLTYHHPSGYGVNLTSTFIKQKGTLWLDRTALRNNTPIMEDENFVITDLVANYRLPKRRGSLSVGVKNAFDKEFQFEDMGSYNTLAPQDTGVPSIYAPERIWFASASLNW